jgi:hypothetical protein
MLPSGDESAMNRWQPFGTLPLFTQVPRETVSQAGG